MRVRSSVITASGSSTTQMVARSRWSERQMLHGSTSVTLPHTEQKCTDVLHVQDRFGQVAHRLGRLAQQVERQPLGGLGPDAGQRGKRLDGAGDGLDVHAWLSYGLSAD